MTKKTKAVQPKRSNVKKYKAPGAPARYRPEYAIRAYRLCLLGAIDKELAALSE